MSREQQTTELINRLGTVNATEVLLSDIAISLAQIADMMKKKNTVYISPTMGCGGRGGE